MLRLRTKSSPTLRSTFPFSDLRFDRKHPLLFQHHHHLVPRTRRRQRAHNISGGSSDLPSRSRCLHTSVNDYCSLQPSPIQFYKSLVLANKQKQTNRAPIFQRDVDVLSRLPDYQVSTSQRTVVQKSEDNGIFFALLFAHVSGETVSLFISGLYGGTHFVPEASYRRKGPEGKGGWVFV